MSYAGLGAAPSGPWAEIVGKNGFRYRLTDADVLWAGRMSDGEGDADAPKVLWTMASRFTMLRRRGSFKNFIQAYSQPINQKWRRRGVCCAHGATGCPARPSRSFYGEPECSESRLARRERMSTMPWDQLPSGVRANVLAWARAEMSNPVPTAVDFAAPYLVRRKMARDSQLQIVSRGLNWFVSKPVSRQWSADFVTMRLGDRVAGASMVGSARRVALLVGGPVLLAGAASFAYWAYKQAR